ncbi:ABC transporter permease [Myxococcota bacterium]|nr:ABC transporter permease [Myxococcota bacterium]
MSPLGRKLLRDLKSLKGQVATISIVLTCGLMAMIMLQSTYESLLGSREEYYREQRFADVFARLERAPDAIADRLEQIPGVSEVYTRVVEDVMVPLATEPEPIPGRVVSIPEDGIPPMNGLHLSSGRMPSRGATREVLVLDQFAKAHGLVPGDHLPVVLNGSLESLEIVGIAMSPEYVFAMSGFEMIADVRRFVVFWMHRSVVAPRFRMEGAFNDVVLRLEPAASTDAVLQAIDRELDPYGGFHAIARENQMSNWFLQNELKQLSSLALMLPTIFLGVAAFLVNIVISRLVFLERTQIAVLKAIGYSNRQIAMHYLGFVAVIVAIGTALGVALGARLGLWMAGIYTEFFRFPTTLYELSPSVVLLATAIGTTAAVAGALISVRRVAMLPPAEAMRPPAPIVYKRTILSRLGLTSLVGPSATMVARGIVRKPLRFLLSVAGIAMGVGIYILGTFSWDSFDYLMLDVFPRENRADFSVVFARALPERALRELEHLPGVRLAEGLRTVPVRFESGSLWRDGLIFGIPARSELRRIHHELDTPVTLPDEGVVLTERLAELLDVRVGEHVHAELLEGRFEEREMLVAGIVDEPMGLQAYVRRDWLDHVLREEPRVNQALLAVERGRADELREHLKRMPPVLSVVSMSSIVQAYRKQTGASVGAITTVLTLCAAAISIGIVYNNARIALSMRARELASLRVLGFRRKEISAILLGELALQVALGIPLGLWFGRLWASFFSVSVSSDQIRFPLRIDPETYAIAAIIALVAGIVSALFVRRKLDHLELTEVLKASE